MSLLGPIVGGAYWLKLLSSIKYKSSIVYFVVASSIEDEIKTAGLSSFAFSL